MGRDLTHHPLIPTILLEENTGKSSRVALTAALALGGARVRWTRHTAGPAVLAAGAGGLDEQLEARLDDELRDLD